MRQVFIITNAFPYEPGEDFLALEIDYWAREDDLRIVVLPMAHSPRKRSLATHIQIDDSLTTFSLTAWLAALAQAPASPLFLREVKTLLRKGALKPRTLMYALYVTLNTLQILNKLRKRFKNAAKDSVIYCYWNNHASYAAALLAQRTPGIRCVTRAHGYDLYQHRSRFDHHPLKHQTAKLFDKILTISKDGKSYYCETYQVPTTAVSVHRLGISIPEIQSPPTAADKFRLVSVAYCTRIKRIDKIIAALALLATELHKIHVHWTHIGNGPLFESLQKQSEQQLSVYSNLRFDFKGYMSRSDIDTFYASQPIDVIVNCSDSEGIPVSLMEAMSFGIPAIAPQIGGVAELVDNSCGLLISPQPDVAELSNALKTAFNNFKSSSVRSNAKQRILEQFNANTNYPEAISEILNQLKTEANSRNLTMT